MIYFSWLLPVPVLLAITFVMYRRRQHSIFPLFWGFICFQAVRLVFEAAFYWISWKQGYFYAYWVSALCSSILNLLLLRSIFLTVIHRYSSVTRIRAAIYETALACVWVIGGVIAYQGGAAQHLWQVIARVGQALSFAEVGMFIFVVVTSAVLGVKWSEGSSGIAAALGLLAGVDLLFYAGLAQLRIPFTGEIAGTIQTAAYFLAVAIFAFYFLPRRVAIISPTTRNPELLEWAESARKAVSK